MIYPGCMMFFRRKKYRLVSVYQKKFAKKKTKYLDLLKFDQEIIRVIIAVISLYYFPWSRFIFHRRAAPVRSSGPTG